MRKTGIIVGGILIVAIVLVTVVKLSRSKQAAFNNTDLRPTRAQGAIGSNGFPLLLQAGKLLAVSELEESSLSDLATGRSWDEAQAMALLRTNQTALAALHRAWSCPSLQVDAITNFNEEFPYLDEWRKFSQLALVEARISFHAGNEAEAFGQAMDVVRFGHRVEGSGGGVLHYLVGCAIKTQGLECLRSFADNARLPPEKLLATARKLKGFEASQDDLREVLKVAYATQADMLDGFPGSVDTNSAGPSIPPPSFLYSATRSKRELTVRIRLTMAAMTNCYAIGIKMIPTEKTNVSMFWRLMHGNVIGTIMNELDLDSPVRLLTRKCKETVSLRATRTVLALRAFQLTNGRNAQSLEELPPDFLEAVPMDDFDGKQLRYSSSRKVVYSVGENLNDDGGVQSTNRSKAGDLIYRFSF